MLEVREEYKARTVSCGSEIVSFYIAVKFLAPNGVELWTNFSRDGIAWLLTSRMSAIELPTPGTAAQ